MNKTVKTPKGTVLPLTNLKGKDYLMVAYRIQWMNEEAARFEIKTSILKAEKDESIVQAAIVIYDDKGQMIKTATATKREDSKGFGDHLEKAETGAIGRALAVLGYGTQFALADLDEGDRIVDSPLQNTKASTPAPAAKSPAYEFKPPKSSTAATNGSAKTETKNTPVKGWT